LSRQKKHLFKVIGSTITPYQSDLRLHQSHTKKRISTAQSAVSHD